MSFIHSKKESMFILILKDLECTFRMNISSDQNSFPFMHTSKILLYIDAIHKICSEYQQRIYIILNLLYFFMKEVFRFLYIYMLEVLNICVHAIFHSEENLYSPSRISKEMCATKE